MDVMIAVIIQARMTSTRLPGKVLADLCGKPALERMIARVRRARLLDEIVVATTTNAADDQVVALCEGLGVAVHRGDEQDVLGRFREAAEAVGATGVMRLTADCPMTEPALIDEAVAMFRKGSYDYVSNIRVRTYPDGLDLEIFSREALEQAAREATHPYLREHVTGYIHGLKPDYPHGEFARGDLVFVANFSHIRWSVDYPEDLARIRRFFSVLPEDFTWLQALSLATREPELLGLTSKRSAN